MLGGRDQTTFSFTRKMAAGSSGDEALSDDQDASGGRRRQLNRRENTVGSEKARGALWNTAQSRPINYTVLDKTVDLSARWLRRMRLDGFVFNYRCGNIPSPIVLTISFLGITTMTAHKQMP